MADFFNSGWSVFVAAATLLSLLGCLALLYIASRRRPMAADNSTGHVWDENLVELNNPLPRWWMVLFVLTVLFSFANLYFYPGAGSAKGSLDWSSAGELIDDQRAAASAMDQVYAAYRGRPAADLAGDAGAMAIGQRLFINHCATCHGSNARGSKGFPDLTDRDWLHGGTPEKIEESIALGRVGQMPPMAAAVGSAEDVRNVAHHVLKLSGSPHNSVAAAFGRAKYTSCAACHGPDGKGNPILGAPNLTDQIWLHGYGEQAIIDIVTHGKTSIMPAQRDRLSADQIHVLASYVWSLSHGGSAASR
jgi:cytochrome c oxidase cbb3-type subunit 3